MFEPLNDAPKFDKRELKVRWGIALIVILGGVLLAVYLMAPAKPAWQSRNPPEWALLATNDRDEVYINTRKTVRLPGERVASVIKFVPRADTEEGRKERSDPRVCSTHFVSIFGCSAQSSFPPPDVAIEVSWLWADCRDQPLGDASAMEKGFQEIKRGTIRSDNKEASCWLAAHMTSGFISLSRYYRPPGQFLLDKEFGDLFEAIR
jgi:hypothetical protein